MSLIRALLFAVLISAGTVLPISSSGHLSLLNGITSVSLPAGTEYLFCGFSYLGTALGIFLLNRRDMLCIGKGIGLFGSASRKESTEKKRILLLVLVSVIPSVLTLILRKLALRLACSIFFCALAFLLQAALLLFASNNDHGERTEKQVTIKDALLIGFLMLLAALPGFSHIGCVYSLSILAGFSKKFASFFTQLVMFFLLLSGFFLLLILGVSAGISWSYFAYCLLAVPVSAASGVIGMRIFSTVSRKFGLSVFGYYDIVIGLTALLLSQIS